MGWSQMLAALKAWTEHRIDLREGMYKSGVFGPHFATGLSKLGISVFVLESNQLAVDDAAFPESDGRIPV